MSLARPSDRGPLDQRTSTLLLLLLSAVHLLWEKDTNHNAINRIAKGNCLFPVCEYDSNCWPKHTIVCFVIPATTDTVDTPTQLHDATPNATTQQARHSARDSPASSHRQLNPARVEPKEKATSMSESTAVLVCPGAHS